MMWVQLGIKLLPLIIGAVQSVEHLLSGLKGNEKKEASMDMVVAFLMATEGVAGKDLLNDNDVRIATGKVIDAVVALQNVVASRPVNKK